MSTSITPEDLLLAIDVGNTDVHVGVFSNEKLVACWSLKTDTGARRDDYGTSLTVLFQRHGLDQKTIGHAVLGSVVPPLTPVFEDVLRYYCGVDPLIVRAGTRTGIRLVYDPVFELGADRIAHAVAVERMFGTPAIVVDFGTATTFDAVGDGGAYLGGAIGPGLSISADSLWRRTAQLHRIHLTFPARAIGRNTAEAVQSGLLFGHVGMTKEMISRIRAELGGEARVIATGDLAPLIVEHVPEIQSVEPHLALHGLRLIHGMNVPADTAASGVNR